MRIIESRIAQCRFNTLNALSPPMETERTSPGDKKTLMLTRRQFLIRSSLVAAGTNILPRVFGETSAEQWPPYRRSLAIDGQGGSSVFYLQDNDPALAAELQ